MTGYEALRERSAWFPLERAVIRATGDDRVRLLHAMATNNIQQLSPGQGCYTFFLNAQGRVLADAHVFLLPESLLVVTEPELGDKLYQHIDNYIIADDVTLEREQFHFTAFEGPGGVAAGAGIEPHSIHVEDEDATFLGVTRTGQPGYWVMSRGEAAGGRDAEPADAEAVETVRIENGRPIYGIDFSEANIAHETRQIDRAVHFNKGCYLGQEIVERVRSRGHVNRGLASLRIEGHTVPARGTKVLAAGKEAGEITSAAYSPALGQVAAIAMLRAAAGVALEVDGTKAVQV